MLIDRNANYLFSELLALSLRRVHVQLILLSERIHLGSMILFHRSALGEPDYQVIKSA